KDDIEEDENEPELTYPYEEVDPLNPPPPASESHAEDVIEVENPIKHKDETVPASVDEVGESSTSSFLREDNDGLLPSLSFWSDGFSFKTTVWLKDDACIGREERKSK
ncbi:hypothetical protein Tco_0069752, partial [Tanacetum coccineum]